MQTLLVKGDWHAIQEFAKLTFPKESQFCFLKHKDPNTHYFRTPLSALAKHVQDNLNGFEMEFDPSTVHHDLYTWGQRGYFL